MEDKASAYWDKCKDLLRGELTESAFRTWFAGIEPLSFENGVLKLQLQSQFVAEYIEDNYSSLLGRVLFRVCGPGARKTSACAPTTVPCFCGQTDAGTTVTSIGQPTQPLTDFRQFCPGRSEPHGQNCGAVRGP